MDRIKFLQNKKLLKELDYIQSDYDYKNEIINEADSQFIININTFLENYPELKQIYDERIDAKMLHNIDNKLNSEMLNKDLETIDNKPTHLKKIYREIVKMTHPDIIDDKKMNEYYINATNQYNENNEIGIYKICMELNIEQYIEEINPKLIEQKILELKKRIEFLENTLAWVWLNTEDEKQKQELLIKYIKTRVL